MGLDMYLYAETVVEKVNWDKLSNLKQQKVVPINADDLMADSRTEETWPVYNKFKDIVKRAGLDQVHTDVYGAKVSVTCAYWRKANQIHGWFVKNIQGGEDDCREYYVSLENLHQLYALITESLDTRDPNLIPPTEGFFFGSNDIDEFYWNDLQDTKDQLERIFALPNLDKLYFKYSSSW